MRTVDVAHVGMWRVGRLSFEFSFAEPGGLGKMANILTRSGLQAATVAKLVRSATPLLVASLNGARGVF
jgi:hypothetical protein